MPVMDGYQAADEIKKFSQATVIALTASVMTEDFEQMKSEKFDGYLRKPVLKAELYRELSKYLPFDEIPETDIQGQSKVLSVAEINRLPDVLQSLQKLTEQYDGIAKNNNILTIKSFSETLTQLTGENTVSLVTEYQQQLKQEIENFDISAIRKSLQHYELLVQQLEQLNAGTENKVLPEFATIDIKQGLYYSANNERVYRGILQNFIKRYQNLNLEELTEDGFKLNTHTIKGLSGSIGAKSLHVLTRELDDTQDKQLLPEFYKLLAEVIAEIEQYLDVCKP